VPPAVDEADPDAHKVAMAGAMATVAAEEAERREIAHGAEVVAPPPPRLPPPPLLVDVGEMKLTQRLDAARTALFSTSQYVPPEAGGTMADAELRRLRALLGFVSSGELPASADLELRDIEQKSTLQIQRTLAEAEAHLLSEDVHTLRPLQTPVTLLEDAARPPPKSTPGETAAVAIGGERERDLLLSGIEFNSSENEATALTRPSAESAAEQLARRVAERREQLQQGMARYRVNLYARQPEQMVETAERAQEQAALASAGGDFATALVGF